jgi:hypothetical protein
VSTDPHTDGRHESTDARDRAFWAKTCPACAGKYDTATGLPILTSSDRSAK